MSYFQLFSDIGEILVSTTDFEIKIMNIEKGSEI